MEKTSDIKKLTGFLKKYNAKKQIISFCGFLIIFLTSFIISSVFFWLLTFVTQFFDSYFFEQPFFPLIIALIITVIYEKKDLKIFFKKKSLTNIASKIEAKQNFSGMLISSADFIEKKYDHDKNLESKYLHKTAKLISQTNIVSPEISGLIEKIKFLFIFLILFFIPAIFIKNSPFKYFKDTFFYVPPKLTFTVDYKKYVEQGKSLKVRVEGNADKVSIFTGSSRGNLKNQFVEKALLPDTNLKVWTFIKKKTLSDFYFKVELAKEKKRIVTKIYKIKTFTYPAIKDLRLVYSPPKVYRLKPVVFKDTGSVEGFKGSRISLNVKYTNKIKNAKAVFKSGKVIKAKVSGNIVDFSFTLTKRDEYRVIVKDVYGHANTSPPVYSVIPLQDKKPVLTILYPNKDIVSRNTDFLRLKIKAEDDYGLRLVKVKLHKFVNPDDKKPLFKKTFKSNLKERIQITGEYKIGLTELTLNPGEVLKYRVFIYDTGGKSASSRWFKVRFPNMFEKLERMERERENITGKIRDILKRQKRIKKQMDEIKQRASKGQADSSDERKLKQLIKKQKDVFKSINKESKRLDKMKKQALTDPDTVNRELAKKLDEINKLLKQVLSEQARKALEQMQKYLKKMQSGREMESLKPSESAEKYIERLRRTIEMLKKLKYFQRLTNARTLLKHMKEKTYALEKAKKNNVNINKRKMKSTADQLETTRKQLSKLLSKIHLRQIKQKLNRAKKQLDTGIKTKISNLGKTNLNRSNIENLNDSLSRMLKEFNKMVKMYSQSNIAEAKEFLEKLVFELINLSKKTHVLYREIEKTNRVRIKFSHLLKKWVSGLQFIQSKLKLRSEKFSSLFEGILKNKKQFLEFFNNLIKINKQITAKLSNKSTFSARQYLKEYNRVKNYFIVMLLKLQDALNKASAKQNMQAKGQNMNSLAEMQRQLNEQVKRMWGKAKSGKLSRAEKRYLKKLARKQAEIAKRIGKILKSGGEAAKRLRKALQAIKKEMEQVSKLLEKEKLNRQTVKKQRRILKRMLNSEMGLESKERDKTRKGEIMTQDEFEQDADIKKRFRDFMNKQSPLRQRNFKNLDPYYRKLIREYFKELKKTLNK